MREIQSSKEDPFILLDFPFSFFFFRLELYLEYYVFCIDLYIH